ncbi:MAG TPA: hypothetical protein VGC09_07835 [Rhodopila sp.]
MTADVHFVQGGEAPVLIGAGDGTLSCVCGNTLIEGFQANRFLGVGIQCGRCGTVTATPPLQAGKMPPPGLIIAEPSSTPRADSMTVPVGIAVVGRAEMDRLAGLLRPMTPADPTYRITPELLDQTAALYTQHVGSALPVVATDPDDAFTGLRDHALAWAVRHLQRRSRDAAWACMQDAPTASAVTHVAGFAHFVATWSRHPLFPVMMATVGERGCSLHGLALFAAAHSLAMAGNRIGFQEPPGYPARLETFDLATGATEVVQVHLDVFDRFEFPFGRPWDPAALRSAVSDVVAAAQGRINLRNPGVLLLSPGTALGGYDEALIEAVKAVMQSSGRKNRGLMGVAPIVLRLQPLPDPHTVRFGYGLFPVPNRHYDGDAPVRSGG